MPEGADAPAGEGRVGAAAPTPPPAGFWFMRPRDVGLFLRSARSDARLRRMRGAAAAAGAAAAEDEAALFDALYLADPDPWASASPRYLYQARKYDGLLALLPPGRRFRHALDLGCGPGLLSERLLRRGLADQVLGLDVSAAAARLAEARCAGLPGARFARGDLRALDPALDGGFDLVVAADTLYYLPPQELTDARLKATAARLARLLAPGGLLLLADHSFGGLDRDSRLARRIHQAFRWAPALDLVASRRRPFWVADLFAHPGEAAGSVGRH